MKKLLVLAMVCCMVLAGSATTVLAADIPDGTGTAGVGFTGEDISYMTLEEQQDHLKDLLGGYSTKGTVYGDAGSSWVYLNRVDVLKSQASFGINCDYTMAVLAWGLAYSDGESAAGVALPFSKDWSRENVEDHTAPAVVTVTLTATATTLDGRVLTSLLPTDVAYIY